MLILKLSMALRNGALEKSYARQDAEASLPGPRMAFGRR
jgi:hypothetical protein